MNELVLFNDAKRSMAALHSTDEVTKILNKSVAMQVYAQQAKDTDLVVKATEVRERAERRLGELMAPMPKDFGGRPIENRVSEKPSLDKPPTLSSLGIDKNLADRARKKSKLTDEAFEAHVKKATQRAAKAVEDKTAFRKEEQAARNAGLIQRAAAFPDKKYHILLADPPWRYENPPIGDSGRSIENHYPTMTVADIVGLSDVNGRSVTDLSAPDALLYLWTTAPKLAESLQVVAGWGFDYRTHLVWVKDKIGTGYHARAQHELVLIGRRGEIPPPPPELRVSSVIFAARGHHSAKPVDLHERIEHAYPELAKVELFCRSPRPGWDAWGYEANNAA